MKLFRWLKSSCHCVGRHGVKRGTALAMRSNSWGASADGLARSSGLGAVIEFLEGRVLPAISVGVIGGLSNTSGFAAIVNQLNNDTYFDFNATLLTDAQADTVGELNAFDVIIIGNSGAGGTSYATYQSALRTWVESGHGVVATGWIVDHASSSLHPDIAAIIPISLENTTFANGGTLSVTNGSHPITSGVGNFTLTGGDYIESSGLGADPGTMVLATSAAGPAVVAANVGLGRSVYLGPIYSGYSGYANAELRSGNPDKLLEQAVAWAASNAPAPPAVNLSVSSTTGTEAGQTQITVTATAASAVNGDQTVNLVVTGNGITAGDYGLTDGDAASGIQIKILSGQTIGTVTFTVLNDLLNEVNETATLTSSNPSSGLVLGSTTARDITIVDNDPGTFGGAISGSGDEDTTLTGTMTFTDVGSNIPSFTVTVLAANGSASIDSGSGLWSYLPNDDFYGTDDFTVSVTDNDGTIVTQVVSLTISPVNDTPTIDAQTFSIAENSANGVTVGTVVADDVDVGDTQEFAITDGNSLGAFDISPAGVITVANSSQLNFETNPTFILTISVTDTDGLSASATVTINLTNVNEAPVAVNGTLNAFAGFPKTGILVVNDVDTAPAQLTISVVTGPSHGTLLITDAHTGAYTYTATAGYTGPDSFTFKAHDGEFNSNTATVSVTVGTFVPAPPVIVDNANASSYSETGSWKNKATQGPAGYLGDLRYAHPNATLYTSTAYDNGVRVGNPGQVEFATANVDTATFTFSNLPAGTYQVGVTYKAASNRATNASFTVAGTGVAPQTVSINQQLTPSSFTTGVPANTGWQTLVAAYGSISANGTITVTLTSAGANGYVIADAVIIKQIAPLEAASGPAANPVSQSLSASELKRMANAAVDRWAAAGLTATQLAVLNNVQFQIEDLPGAGLGVQAGNVITIDPNAAGYGWYIDKTLKNDKEFSKTASSTDLHAPASSPAFGKMDLLTVVMHELGHAIGLEHSASDTDVMSDRIDVGIRRVPAVAKPAGRGNGSSHSVIRIANNANGQSAVDTPAIAVVPNRGHGVALSAVTGREKEDAGLGRGHARIAKSSTKSFSSTAGETLAAGLDQLFATGLLAD